MSMQDNIRNQARQNNGNQPVRNGQPVRPVNGKPLSEQKAAPNKKAFNWSIKQVSEKDKNKKQWPFKVVRDEGKPTRMDCRSITDLKKSFEGTPYNLNECKRVKGRFTTVMDIMKRNHIAKVPNIVYMLISYDSVYFMLDDDLSVYGGNYSNTLLSKEDAISLFNGFMVKNHILENKMNEVFQSYNNSYSPGNPMSNELSNQLARIVKQYTDSRKNMCVVDSSKNLVDIFNVPDFTFSSLKYLVFVGGPEVAVDHQGIVYDCLTKYFGTQSLNGGIMNGLYELPSLKEEYNSFVSFVNKIKQDKSAVKSLKYIYDMTNKVGTLDKESVKNLFLSLKAEECKDSVVYEAPLTDAERKEINKKIEELKKKTGEDVIEECKTKFLTHFSIINNLISKINVILTSSSLCYQVSNEVEKDIWAKYLCVSREDTEGGTNKLKPAIQAEYDYKRFSSENPKEVDVYNFQAMYKLGEELSNEKGGFYAPEGLLSFYNLLPTYFKDARKTKDSMGVGFDTAEKAEKSLEIIQALENQIVDFFEVFLGCQYGILATYMKRFMNIFGKEQAAEFAIQLMPSIQNEGVKLKCSRNVLSIAERFLYRDLGYSLVKTDEKYYGTEESKSELGKYESFCKVAIDKINGYTTELLTHSDLSSTEEIKKAKAENLVAQYDCVKFIFEQYKVFFKIQNVM